MKKLCTIIMALVMLLSMGTSALAAEQSVSLTLTDPYFEQQSVYDPGNNVKYDLTGLSLALEGIVIDETTPSALAISLAAQGAKALAGYCRIDEEGNITATLDGMEYAVTLPKDTLSQATSAPTAAAVSPTEIAALTELLEGVEMTEAGTEEVEFYGGGRLTAQKTTFTLTNELFGELITQMGLSSLFSEGDSISADCTMWVDSTNQHQRVEFQYHYVISGLVLEMTLTMQAFEPSEGTVYTIYSLEMTPEGEDPLTGNGSFMVVPSQEFEGFTDVYGELTLSDASGDGIGMHMIAWPSAAENGTAYTASLVMKPLDASINEEISFGLKSVTSDNAFTGTFAFSAPDTPNITVDVDNQTDGDIVSGTIGLKIAQDGERMIVRTGYTVNHAADVVIPDFSGVTIIDASSATEAELEALSTDAMAVLMQGLGTLMQVPALQEILLSVM